MKGPAGRGRGKFNQIANWERFQRGERGGPSRATGGKASPEEQPRQRLVGIHRTERLKMRPA